MGRRGWQGAPPPRPGFQRHHLFPLSLLARPQMAAMFADLRREGFALQKFDCNGVILPSCEKTALLSRHALHRGPHRGYSDVVTARVDHIRLHFERQVARGELRAARHVAVMRLRLTQATLRRALTDRHGNGFWLNRRDPMRLFVDRSYLDAAIDRLFGPIII